MLSIKWITGVDYYLKKKGKRRAGDGPEDAGDPDEPEDASGLDYYFDIGEGLGEWWGDGATLLGLQGTVKPADLQALCQGFSPDGTPLIQNAGAEDHQQAWDLTFSAVKSLSVLWSQVDTPTRLKIETLHRQAVSAALGYLAEVAVITRRGKGGAILEPALPIVAIFGDMTSRELDPQLHSHCLLLNVAGRMDGTFGTILSQPFYRHKLTAGAIYQTELAHLLRNELGLKLEQEGTAFRIVGVPEKLVDHYSTRSKQIRARLHSKGHHSAKAAAIAALDTRQAKPESPPSFSELLQRWQETNRQFSFTSQAAKRLFNRAALPLNLFTLERRIAEAMRALLTNESFFSEQALIRQAARAVMAEGIAARDLINLVRAFLVESPEVVPLAAKEEEPLFTTKEILAIEKAMLTAIDQGKTSKSHVVRREIVERILSNKLPLHTDLTDDERTRNEEQREAILKVTARAGSVQVIEGMAGTGKTYTLNVARQIWSKAGFRVIGMALSAAAAANLQEGATIDSDTIAMRLAQLEGDYAAHHKRQLKRLLTGKRTYAYRGPKFRLNSKTIVVVDEAAMVGTRQFAEIVRHVASAGAKLVLVGDRRQLQPIEAGGPFAAVADRTDKAELNHVVRQKVEPDDPNPTWHRQAGQLIAAGHVAHAMKLFAERGRLSVLPERDDAMLSLVRDWSVSGIVNPTDHIVLAGTRDEVAALNHQCQSARLAADALGTDHIQIGEQSIHLGDIVLFTKNARVLGVNNGDRGRVLGFNRFTKNMAVELERTKKTVFIGYRSYTHIQLGYAMTTHKAQGATVPSVYVLLGGAMQDRHLSYVQATRACESTRLYVDKCHAGPDLKHLLNQMAKLRPKRLASQMRSTSPPDKAPPRIATEKNVSHPSGKAKKPAATPAKKAAPKKPPATVRPQASPPDLDQIEKLLAALTEKRAATPKKRAPLARPMAEKKSAPSNVHVAESLPSSTPLSNQPTTTPHNPAPAVPTLKFDFSFRDILDLSHVNIEATMDRSVLDAAVSRYGKLPGGIVVEGKAHCDLPLRSLKIDSTFPERLIINGTHRFDTGLTGEEVALLWQAVFETKQATRNFGALVQTEAIGIDNDTVVAHSLMKADNALGGIVYGFDSTFTLPRSSLSSYRNPHLDELYLATFPGELPKLCFNYLLDLNPQVFLRISDVCFAASGAGRLAVTASKVQAAIGVVCNGAVATSIPSFGGRDPAVQEQFPCVHKAFQHFVQNFVHYARQEPCLARSLAYAEVITLLRRAHSAKALILGHDKAQSILSWRARYPLPRFDYTLRSEEFAWRAMDIARYLARRADADSFDGFMAALAGLRYASLAGDFDSFLTCKKAAFSFLLRHYRQPPDSNAPSHHHELHRLFDRALDKTSNLSHDVLISNCIHAAAKPTASSDEQRIYLNDALRLCGSDAMIRECAATRCHWLEIKSHLDPTFDPVPGFAQARAKDLSLTLPFAAFNRIKTRRRLTPRHENTRDQIVDAIQRLKRERAARPSDFSAQLLHRNNPFVASHELLDLETIDGLEVLLTAVRKEVESFASVGSEPWWRRFLEQHAASPKTDASKVAVLVAYELKARGRNVAQLYDEMARLGTDHPQAAMLAWDLETYEDGRTAIGLRIPGEPPARL
ncbi:MAG: MobF family relaxase [Pirellulales bacterium]